MPASNPLEPSALPVQGPDPSGNLGWPIAIVGAPGGDPVNVSETKTLTTGSSNTGQGPNLTEPGSVSLIHAIDSVDSKFYPLEIFDNPAPIGPQDVSTKSQLAVAAITWVHTSRTNAEPERSPCIFNSVAANAAGNTIVWTPTINKFFRLLRYIVEVTGNASIAGAGAVVTVSLLDGAAGATGQVHSVFVPLVALAGIGLLTTGWIDLGNGYLSIAANNVLNVNLSAALVTGNVRVICCGTEE